MKGSELKMLREKSSMTQQKLADTLGVHKRTVINWEQSDVLSKRKVQLIQSIFADGANNSTLKEPDALWVKYESFMLVPLVGQRAQAGFLVGYEDEEYIDDLPKIPWEIDKEYKGQYLTFEVTGDSMDSGDPKTAILDRDLLLCREIQKHHWQNKLHINKWNFVLVHREEGILIKRIINHNTETGELTLHSLNPFYEDYTINIKDLIAIYNAVDLRRKPIL